MYVNLGLSADSPDHVPTVYENAPGSGLWIVELNPTDRAPRATFAVSTNFIPDPAGFLRAWAANLTAAADQIDARPAEQVAP